MKLHSEISVCWAILFAFILASLSGSISTNNRLQPPVTENGYQKNLVVRDNMSVENLKVATETEPVIRFDSIAITNYYTTKINSFGIYRR